LHTGQHYDEKMSEVFWKELEIPKVINNLNIGFKFTGRTDWANDYQNKNYIINAKTRYKAIIVYGDTNSTLSVL